MKHFVAVAMSDILFGEEQVLHKTLLSVTSGSHLHHFRNEPLAEEVDFDIERFQVLELYLKRMERFFAAINCQKG
jgi:hypothetical protein